MTKMICTKCFKDVSLLNINTLVCDTCLKEMTTTEREQHTTKLNSMKDKFSLVFSRVTA